MGGGSGGGGGCSAAELELAVLIYKKGSERGKQGSHEHDAEIDGTSHFNFFGPARYIFGFLRCWRISGIWSLEIGFAQIWNQDLQALEEALCKPCQSLAP
jgi:hypothetical protein